MAVDTNDRTWTFQGLIVSEEMQDEITNGFGQMKLAEL